MRARGGGQTPRFEPLRAHRTLMVTRGTRRSRRYLCARTTRRQRRYLQAQRRRRRRVARRRPPCWEVSAGFRQFRRRFRRFRDDGGPTWVAVGPLRRAGSPWGSTVGACTPRIRVRSAEAAARASPGIVRGGGRVEPSGLEHEGLAGGEHLGLDVQFRDHQDLRDLAVGQSPRGDEARGCTLMTTRAIRGSYSRESPPVLHR